MSLNKILYVEDEPDIQEIAVEALTALGGFEIKPCSSGQEALDCAEAFGPDLILLDVMMPGIDGPATLVELRKLGPLKTTPVVFMTAKVQTHEITHYKRMGALEVIKKPFDPMTLSDQLKKIWAGAQA